MRTFRPAAPGGTSQAQPARNPCRAHNDVRGDRPVRQPLVFARYGYPVLVIAVLLMAAGEMIYAPTVSAFVTTRAGRDRRASYQAALSITEDIGTAIGPISGLALAAATGAATVWAAGAILSALAGTGTGLAAATGPPEHPGQPGPAPS
jgi:MFS family permease